MQNQSHDGGSRLLRRKRAPWNSFSSQPPLISKKHWNLWEFENGLDCRPVGLGEVIVGGGGGSMPWSQSCFYSLVVERFGKKWRRYLGDFGGVFCCDLRMLQWWLGPIGHEYLMVWWCYPQLPMKVDDYDDSMKIDDVCVRRRRIPLGFLATESSANLHIYLATDT